MGKTVGDKLEVTIEPEAGYGIRRDELLQKIPRSAFEGIDNLQVGMQFESQTEQGPMPIRVTAIEGDTVTVDGNHELAGIRLHFAVSVESIREATAEEISHGHVH